MTTHRIDTSHVTKFDGSYSNMWKHRLTLIFKAEKLWHLVSGIQHLPVAPTAAEVASGSPPLPFEKKYIGAEKKCFYCKKPGHQIKDCRTRIASSSDLLDASLPHEVDVTSNLLPPYAPPSSLARPFGIRYQKSSHGDILHGYSDADWAGCKDTRRSISGYCFSWWCHLLIKCGRPRGRQLRCPEFVTPAPRRRRKEAAAVRRNNRPVAIPKCAQLKFDKKTGTSIANGAHHTAKLIILKYAACGYLSNVDTRDKLTKFKLHNHPATRSEVAVSAQPSRMCFGRTAAADEHLHAADEQLHAADEQLKRGAADEQLHAADEQLKREAADDQLYREAVKKTRHSVSDVLEMRLRVCSHLELQGRC